MRDILFRGKTEQGEWVYGFYTLTNNNQGMQPSIITETEMGCSIPALVIPSTIGQYTGLKDKNGRKIFEGDLLRVYDPYNGLPADGFAEVVFSHEYVGGWIMSADGETANIGTRTNAVEVVGNIHDREAEGE